MATDKKKKVTKSAAPTPAPAAEAKTSKRGVVLIKRTASQLHDLIGDTPIGVSRKELKALITAKAVADIGGDDL